jgi:hypothetical protein
MDVFSLAGIIGLACNGKLTVLRHREMSGGQNSDKCGFDFSKVDNSRGIQDFLNKMADFNPQKRPSLDACFDFFVNTYAKAYPKDYGIPALETELKALVKDLEKEAGYYEMEHYKSTAKSFMGGLLPGKSPDQGDSTAKQKQHQFNLMKDEVNNLIKIMRADEGVVGKYEAYKKMAEAVFDKSLKDPILNTKRSRATLAEEPRSIKHLKVLKERLDAHAGHYYFKYLDKHFPGPLPKPPVKKTLPQTSLPQPFVRGLPAPRSRRPGSGVLPSSSSPNQEKAPKNKDKRRKKSEDPSSRVYGKPVKTIKKTRREGLQTKIPKKRHKFGSSGTG